MQCFGCRESEIIVPFELVHLPGSGSVPSWLSNSALAPFVSDAVQLEHLLRVVACSASHRFLLAGARRHGTCLASLAACYFFRMVRTHTPVDTPNELHNTARRMKECWPKM